MALIGNDNYEMWYVYRGGEGCYWVGKDEEAGIDVPAIGWNCKMIEYAYVFDCDYQRYMACNSNYFGQTGQSPYQWVS